MGPNARPSAAVQHDPISAPGGGPTRVQAAAVISTLMLLVFLATWHDFSLVYVSVLSDQGYCLQVATRLLDGQMPYRDYVAIWPPLTTLLTAASLEVFGRTMWAGRLPLTLFVAAALPLLYRWLRQSYGRGPSLAAVVAAWTLLPQLSGAGYATIFTLAPALFVFHQLGRMRPGRLMGPAWWAGLACGLAIGLKHNIGIIVGLCAWVRMLCITPYAALAPLGAGRRTLPTAYIRLPAMLAVLGATGYLWWQFPGTTRVGFYLLAPGALLVAAGTWQTLRQERNTPHGWTPWTLCAACAVFAAGVSVVTGPWVVWLAAHEALRPFLGYSLLVRDADSAVWGDLYGQLLRVPAPSATTLIAVFAWIGGIAALRARGARVAWMWVAVTAALVAWASVREGVYGGRRIQPFAGLLLFIAVATWRTAAGGKHGREPIAWTLAGVYLMLAYPSATPVHLGTGLVPAVALTMARAWTWADHTGLPARVAAALLLLCVSGFGWGAWAQAFRLPSEAGYRWALPQRIPGPRGGTWTRADHADAFPALAAQLDVLAPAGAPLVAWPALGILNFYTGRPNPTRMDLYWPGIVTPALERTLLQELADARPPVAVVGMAPDPVFGDGLLWSEHPWLAVYFAQHFVSVGRLGVWDIRMYVPSPEASGD